MKWTEAYATGIPRVDEQHKMLFKSVEDFRGALVAGEGERTYGLLLTFLDRYSRGHFAFEEKCMAEHACPSAQKNKEEHAALTELLAGYVARFKAKGFSLDEAHTLLDTMDAWLDGHICRVDIHLKRCVQAAAR
jgi:hemerythrin-like metal-binding protein